MEKSLLAWALTYAKSGWFVFPLSPNSKVPFKDSEGLLEATTDERKIREWWKSTPNANIGLNCGMSGIVVVDIDTKDGKRGAESLMNLVGDNVEHLYTRQARTWSGGIHYFYEGICTNSASSLAEHIDIRGDGGYVVLAPSKVIEKGKSGSYGWVNNDPEKPGKTLPNLEFPDIFRPKLKETSPVKDIVQIIDGARNSELARIAGLYRRIGMGSDQIYAALLVDNQTKCVRPLPDKEVRSIADSVSRYAPDPRVAIQPKQANPVPILNGGEIMSDEDFLAQCDVEVSWQLEGFVQKSGLLLLSAAPKSGKSDLARNMAKSIAKGEPFLGRRTLKGKVVWVGIAEPATKLRAAQETMDLIGLGISWVTTRPQGPWQPWLAEMIDKVRPDFVVIDEIGRLASDLENINDYSQVVKATQPFIDLRSKYGTTFCLIHHNNKSGGTLGSTAWEGSVDCIMSLTRNLDNTRVLSTKQRTGEDLEPTVLDRDPNTGVISAAMSKHLADQRKAEQRILEALEGGISLARHELAQLSTSGTNVGRCAVDALVSSGFIKATGSGKKGDARKYHLANPTHSGNGNGDDSRGSYIYNPENPEHPENKKLGVNGSTPRTPHPHPENSHEFPSYPELPRESHEMPGAVLGYAIEILGDGMFEGEIAL